MKENWKIGYEIAGTFIPAGELTIDWETGEVKGKVTRRPVMPPPAPANTPSTQWDGIILVTR